MAQIACQGHQKPMQTIFAVGEGNKQYLVNPYLDFEAESDAVTIIGSRRNPPLPFPDSGIVLRGIGGSQIYVTQSRPLARMKR